MTKEAAIAFDGDGVERTAPGIAPSAFRIWKKGENPTDHGMTLFTDRSAKLLMKEQAMRGNLYSIDVGHATLNKSAPIENQRAVGWHRLEVRDGDLWATEVQWAEWVATGFEKSPPEWRYFSPAYDCDEKTHEVVSYTNTAITANPATWSVNALATRDSEGEHMAKFDDHVAAIKKMAEADDEDGHKAKKAYEAITADEAKRAKATAAESEAAQEAAKADDEAPPSSKEAPPSSKPASSKGPPVPPKKEQDSRDPAMVLATRLVELEHQVGKLTNGEERKRLLASRPDLKSAVREWLSKAPMETVREAIKVLPREPKVVAPAAQPSVQATRGAGQKDEHDRSPRGTPAESAAMREAMGLPNPRQDSIRREGNSVVFGVMTQDEAKKRIEARKGN